MLFFHRQDFFQHVAGCWILIAEVLNQFAIAVDGDTLHHQIFLDHFTYQFLADMIGVQRSAVTIAAGVLQQRKLIRYIRGEISILNRRGLEVVSCECYDVTIVAMPCRYCTSDSRRLNSLLTTA